MDAIEKANLAAGYLAKFAKDSGAASTRIVGRDNDEKPLYAVVVVTENVDDFLSVVDEWEETPEDRARFVEESGWEPGDDCDIIR